MSQKKDLKIVVRQVSLICNKIDSGSIPKFILHNEKANCRTAPDVYSGSLKAEQQEGRGEIHVNEYF
jgi:hypothetical protein